ncbi:MAG: PD-(D/E)XK nuclease family protein [Planctomycetota bacterium]
MGKRTLLLSPLGPGSTFSALDLAGAPDRAGPRCVLVLPSRPARDHARNELARRWGSCDPRSVTTLPGLAKALVRRRGLRVASGRERDAALARALLELEIPDHELALTFRGFRQGLLRVFHEVEHNGLSPGTLAGVLRRGRIPEPHVERLTRTFEGYRQHLRRQRWLSEADAYRQAKEAVSSGQAAGLPERIVFDGFTDFTPRQLDLIGALALTLEETVVVWPCAQGEAASEAFGAAARVREQLRDLGFNEAPRPGETLPDPRPPGLRALTAGLFAPGAEPAADAEGLRVIEAASRDDEVELALRAAREFVQAEPGRRWTQVLVIASTPRTYRAALERRGAALGVPVRVRGGLALTDTPLAQGALALVRAAASCEVRPLLSAAACPALGLTPAEADRLASLARAQGLPTLDHEATWEALADEVGGAAALLVREALFLVRGFAALDAPSSRQGSRLVLRAWERLLRAPTLARLGSGASRELRAAREEVAARRELLTLIGDLARLDVPLPPGPDLGLALLTRLEEEVRATALRPRDPRRDVLHVVDPLEASAWEAELVLVLGLLERQFPRAGGDDLYLPEGARKNLAGSRRGRSSLHLATAEDRLGAERFLFYAAATRARRALWLLYPGTSSSGGTPEPSRFLLDAAACFTPEAWAAVRTARRAPDAIGGVPGSTRGSLRRFAYRHVASAAQPTGESAARAALARALLRRLLTEPPELEAAVRALSWVGQDRLQGLDPRLALERVYSASELEAFAACPFRHFVLYRLQARPSDDLASSGLDARRQGTVVHEALQRVYAAGLEPQEALRQAFASGARELEIGLDEDTFFRRASEAVLHFVRDDDPAFLAATELEPWGFERAFGPGTPAGPLEIEVPELGGTAVVRGAIDRVDVAELPGEGPAPRLGAFVTDYKLGAREVDTEYLNAMHQGDRVQLPLYLLAIQRVFGLEPLGAAFAALGVRRRTGVIDPQHTSLATDLPEERFSLYPVPLARALERTEAHIRRTVRGVGEGWVAARPREVKECALCAAQDACRLTPGQKRRRARNGRPLPIGSPG